MMLNSFGPNIFSLRRASSHDSPLRTSALRLRTMSPDDVWEASLDVKKLLCETNMSNKEHKDPDKHVTPASQARLLRADRYYLIARTNRKETFFSERTLERERYCGPRRMHGRKMLSFGQSSSTYLKIETLQRLVMLAICKIKGTGIRTA